MSLNIVSTKAVVHQRWYAHLPRYSFELWSGYEYRSVMQKKMQHLKAMNTLYVLLEDFIDQTVLLYHRDTFKCSAHNCDGIERPAAT